MFLRWNVFVEILLLNALILDAIFRSRPGAFTPAQAPLQAFSIAPVNFTLSCVPTKLVPSPRFGVCVKITQPPFALFPPVPS